MKHETYLPIFSGFYGNTLWEIDYNYIEDFINQDRKELGLYSDYDINDINIDNSAYELDIVKNFCDVLPEFMSDFIISIELQKIISPKKYNFYNDSANVIIDVNIENIKNFIYSNKEKFIEYLKLKYTSCDGFISHYDNDFTSWEIDTKNFTDFNIDSHRLGSVLDFIANVLDIDEFSIYESIIENISIFSYISNLDDVINQSDNSLFEFFTKNNYTKEIASYYNQCYENKTIHELNLNEKTLAIIKEYENNLIEV